MAGAGVVTYNIAVFISTLSLLEVGADQFIDHTAIMARRAGGVRNGVRARHGRCGMGRCTYGWTVNLLPPRQLITGRMVCSLR